MIRTLLLVFLVLGFSSSVFAVGQQWSVEKKDNVFVAGEPEADFEFFEAKKVEAGNMFLKINRSVVACAQMILGNHDLYQTQQDILYRIYGKREDEKKSISALIRRLNGWKPEKGVKVKATSYKIKKLTIADDLEKYGPMIVGIEDTMIQRLGLPQVLLQVQFKYDYFKKKIPLKVVLLDPWADGRQHRTEMTWYDFINNLEWVMRLDVSGR